jgi:hypothetical protein
MIDFNSADISENKLLDNFGEKIFQLLLRDFSSFDAYQSSLKDRKESDGHEDDFHITWATDMYSKRGIGYCEKDQISISSVTRRHYRIIRPRAVKSQEEQRFRTQAKAEVFTPSWICNAQNNLIDSAWFGRKEIFNTENDDHSWTPIARPIIFPAGKNWKDYVSDVRLEISCGEGPYLASRYDTTTGELVPLQKRIGILGRKLRIVSENCDKEKEWVTAAKLALESCYGYEWQGDSLLIARENMFLTVVEYYAAKFGANKLPKPKDLEQFALIIYMNIWQMDGLKCVIPNSCHEEIEKIPSLFGSAEKIIRPCEGCVKDDIKRHNGIYCKIKDWKTGKIVRFIDLIKH